MFISRQSGARGLKRLIWLKYYTERQITFNLALYVDKNTNLKIKGLSKNGSEFNSYKKLNECICPSPPGIGQWGSSLLKQNFRLNYNAKCSDPPTSTPAVDRHMCPLSF